MLTGEQADQPARPIRGVLFDVDDTLFDYTGAARLALEAHLTGLGQRYDATAQARWDNATDVAYQRFLSGELTFAEQRLERARAMSGRPLSDAEAAAWIGEFQRQFRARWVAFPDVLAALDALDGYLVGAVSNSDRATQADKLAHLGLADRFRCVIGMDTAGVAKPHPAIFQAGCAALGVAPAETVYVGDKLDGDAIGARAAGLVGVWLDRAGQAAALAPAGVPVVRDLAELPALLAALNRRRSDAGADGGAAFTERSPVR